MDTDNNVKLKTINKQKMVCQGCFFIYDPMYGDQESNVDPMTNFEEIPEGWKCPICDNTKTQFIPLTEDMLHL